MESLRKRSLYDWLIDVLSFLALIVTSIPIIFYSKLENISHVPIHYNMSGQIDGWGGPRNLISLFLVALAFYLLLYILEIFPKALNLPVKVTSDNENDVYRLAIRLLRHLKLFFTLIFAYLINNSFATALGNCSGGNAFILNGLLCGVILVMIYFAIKMFALRK